VSLTKGCDTKAGFADSRRGHEAERPGPGGGEGRRGRRRLLCPRLVSRAPLRVSGLSRGQGGFTLIEIMIALGLLGLMMALVTGSYYAGARAKRRMEGRQELLAMGRVALDNMIKEINGAYLDENDISSTPFLGEHGGGFEHPDDTLTFVTTAFDPRPLGGGGNVSEIAYRLYENPDIEGSYFLLRRADPFPDYDPDEGGVTYDVAEMVSGLRIRYQDENGIWNDRWDAAVQRNLPRLVEITLHLEGREGVPVQIRGVAAPMRWADPNR